MKFSYTLLRKLAPKTPPIQKLADALSAHSFEVEEVQGDMLDIALPANRYSATVSHVGLAREVAAIFNTPLKNPIKTLVNIPAGQGMIQVSVKDSALASRYSARYFELPKVGESPAEIKKILKTCGINSINAVVDLMNYVMLETGQPLHSFDADTLVKNKRGEIEVLVRPAVKGEKMETLDRKILTLGSDATVIADIEKPLGLAGIKGGLHSGTTKATRRIIVEAACFDPVRTYRASRQYKIVSDASIRFSHGLSPALAEQGMDRATVLLKEMGARLVDSVDYYPKPAGGELIEFDPAAYEKLIGVPVAGTKAKKYFQALGFSIEPLRTKEKGRGHGGSFLVRIPSWRTDMEEPEDLIEEIARLEGLNELRSEPPSVSIRPATEEDTIVLKDRVRNILVNLQLDEVYNSSFIGPADMKGECATDGMFEHSQELVEVENPIADDKKYLRPSLLPLLLKNVKDNARFFPEMKIFELGKVFSRREEGVEEELALGVALARKKDPKLILELKGLIAEFLEGLGLGGAQFGETPDGLRIELDHRVVGATRFMHLDKGLVAAFGELNIGKVLHLALEEREYEPLSKYPAIVRDISLLVASSVRIGQILNAIQSVSPQLVHDVDLIDEYADERFGGERQSLTFRLVFQSDERTLSDEEVNGEMVKIIEALRRKFRAEVR